MTNGDKDLDEFGRHTLEPLRRAPPLDPQIASQIKKQYLVQGASLRQSFVAEKGFITSSKPIQKRFFLGLLPRTPLAVGLAALLVVLVLLLVGGTITVSAAQGSLPGQALYQVKTWSEDARLSLTFSDKNKLNLTLDYTNRRVDEISSLLAKGKTIDNQTTVRFQQELDSALQLAADMNDAQLQNSLVQVKRHAESQGLTMQELLSKLPPQAEPALVRIQERLNEQVELSAIGESNPKEFRKQLHDRELKRKNSKNANGEQPGNSNSATNDKDTPGNNGQGNGSGVNQSNQAPGNESAGDEQGQPSSGNGHKVNPTHTPKP